MLPVLEYAAVMRQWRRELTSKLALPGTAQLESKKVRLEEFQRVAPRNPRGVMWWLSISEILSP